MQVNSFFVYFVTDYLLKIDCLLEQFLKAKYVIMLIFISRECWSIIVMLQGFANTSVLYIHCFKHKYTYQRIQNKRFCHSLTIKAQNNSNVARSWHEPWPSWHWIISSVSLTLFNGSLTPIRAAAESYSQPIKFPAAARSRSLATILDTVKHVGKCSGEIN